jgi:GAF domain-containing protein
LARRVTPLALDRRADDLARENAELRRQLDACHAELAEARAQQTATAEVLQVINSSPGDLAPVFETMLEKACSLCGAIYGSLQVYDGEHFRAVAVRGLPEAFAAFLREGFLPNPKHPGSGILRGESFVQIPDMAELDVPGSERAVKLGGMRTALSVPLRKDGALLGQIVAARPEVRPFSDKEIALLQNFAAQAVIAMENARLITETREALEQQTATSEVLQVINSSPGDLAPVFDAMLGKAMRLCEAAFGVLRTYDGEQLNAVAMRGVPDAYAEFAREPLHPDPATGLGRMLRGERLVHIADIRDDEIYRSGDRLRVATVELGGARTLLVVPLRKDDALLGVITIFRQEVRLFSENQIALLQNFAAQAVIAIENARLITETREALEQQTATAEVLQVINSSPGDLAPVFDAILEKAHSLCEAAKGSLVAYDGEAFRVVAMRGLSAEYAALLRTSQHDLPGSPPQRLLDGESLVQIPDMSALPFPIPKAAAEREGARTVLYVPLRKDGALLGYITVYRQEVRPFTDKQIALLENFAAQAVIAMENARLITETREALEQQTATAEVLQVINSSPGDLAPVFDAMLVKAMRLCEAAFGVLSTYDGEHFHAVALHGVPAGYAATYLGEPYRPGPGTIHDRLIHGERLVHIPDLAADIADDRGRRAVLETLAVRTILAVPLRKDGTLLGIIHLYRQEVRPFADNQISLAENFAAQAVIAMENARLIAETREALEQQTATAEVLQVINSSPGDLAPVFDAILEKAHSLCGADYGALLSYDGERFWPMAGYGGSARVTEVIAEGGVRPSTDGALWKLTRGELFAQIEDTAKFAAERSDPLTRALVEVGGIRTQLVVPLRKDETLLGAITANRNEVRPFSDKQIALLQNFAAQAVIAMENARLLTETREALEQQTATAEVLGVINSSPGDLAPVFDAMLEKAVRLCDTAFGIMQTYDGERFATAALHGVPAALAEWREQNPLEVAPGTAPARLVAGEDLVHHHEVDLTASEAYQRGHPSRRALVDLGGARSHLIVALRKDGALLGTIAVYRQEVRPFSDKQIALLQNFAAQAVIAMENARLLTETREALAQQTATAEVLGVINSSPGDLAPVFDAILEKAHSLCGAASGGLIVFEGEQYRAVAVHGEAQFADYWRRLGWTRVDTTALQRLSRGELIHVPDAKADDSYGNYSEQYRRLVDIADARSLLVVPLRKDNVLLGAITAFRREVRPFSEKEIALLQNFAAQAVIAMENARLLTETREALEQQTATAEVLQVINSSPGDLAPVFDTMLDKAMRLCEAAFGMLWTYDGDNFQATALRGVPPAFAEFLEKPLGPFHRGTGLGRMLHGEDLVIHADMMAEEAYRVGDPLRRAIVDLGGARSAVTVALRKDETLLGAFTVYRREVQPYSDNQIALLHNFAAQAVIAMENARLITETREALEQQTATAEVLQVINSSPGDLAPVFDAMLAKAFHLCEGVQGSLWTFDGGQPRLAAAQGISAEFVEVLREQWERRRPSEHHPMSRLMRGERLVQILDIAASDLYRTGDPAAVAAVGLGRVRTLMFVALLKDAVPVGAFIIARREVRPFTDKQIALVQNFAAQAVIAIENARLITETREALEQQTATAEVLQVINSSPGELAPVFDVILEKAHALCGVGHGALVTYDGELFRARATRGLPAPIDEALRRGFASVPAAPVEPLVRGEPFVHILDMAALAAESRPEIARQVQPAVDSGARTVLMVPLRKDSELLGYIAAGRFEVQAFSEKEIALLQNFAAQAVIAMENARLITETRDALAKQTATAEILRVISGSPTDLQPTFDAIGARATILSGAESGGVFRFDGSLIHFVAQYGWPPEVIDAVQHNFPISPGRESTTTRAILTREVVHIPDAAADPEYALAAILQTGVHTMLSVPILQDGNPVGAITVTRRAVAPFSQAQIDLLKTFADQAVIAIENVRLFTELRQRTRDLQESLEYQTATSDVLKVISRSTFDLQPVLDTLVETAARICRAESGFIFRLHDGLCRMVASFGIPTEYKDFQARNPIAPGRGTLAGRTVLERRAVHIEDAAADPEYTRVEAVQLGRQRTMIGVPLVREDALIGVITLARSRVEPFTEKQIALVTTFADQAVIAIENARLLNELRERTGDLQESLEYQTAISDVLKVISRSAFDLQTVLQTVAATAIRLCRADSATIYRNEGGEYRWAAGHMLSPEYEKIERAVRIRPGSGTVVGRAAMGGNTVQILDAWTDPLYEAKDDARIGGVHTMIGVPLLRENTPIGAIGLARKRVEAFTEREIALVATFADQAVIAIENARLFDELRARTAELGRSVEELKMLSEVGRAVSSTLDLRAVLSTILTASLGVTMANAGAVFRYSRAERAFRLVEAVGWDEALADSVRELHVAESGSAMGQAIAIRGPVELPDLSAASANPLREATLAAGFHSALIVPLVGAERVFGAITLMRHDAGEFPPETVRLMQTLASQSVLAIQNARLFREIADKSEQLALASQHKSQFLANMSHELRTPLNAILGYAELLVDGIYGVLPEKAQGVLERVQNNGKHLLALINDVLDLARIEAGQLNLTLEDYALPEVVRAVVAATEPLAAAKGLKFTATVQDGLPTAHGDARRVSQVLLNLVGNAIKFTDRGAIEITAAAANGQFALEVRDTGPGIADADQERIFGEFQQIDNSSTRKQGGTGLGLAISKRMVEMQGGMISVDSALGQGSTFRVVLPVHVEPALEEAA